MLDVVHESLPMDGRIWRIDWFGPVRLSQGSLLEYEIAVVFRRLARGSKKPPTPTYKIIHIGVGALSSLRLGSLWQDGRLVGHTDAKAIVGHVDMTTHRILSGPLSTAFAKSGPEGAEFRFGSLVIPPKMGDESVLVAPFRPVGDDQRNCEIRIPLFEVARAWYLRESEMTQRLLSAPLGVAIEALHDRTQMAIAKKSRKRKAKLTLAVHPDVTQSAIPIIAMLEHSEPARVGARRLIDQIVTAAQLQRPVSLEALPPFKGRFKVRAVGKMKEIGERHVFFANYLSAVELPHLPRIEWFRSESDEKTERTDVMEGQEPGKEPRVIPDEIRIVQRQEPSKRGGSFAMRIEVASFLNVPKIMRREPAKVVGSPGSKAKIVSTIGGAPIDAATGVPTSNADGPAILRYKAEPASDRPPTERTFLPPGFEALIATAKLLAGDKGIVVGTVSGRDYTVDPSGFRLTAMPGEYAWAVMAGRTRQALCIEIVFDTKFYYLIEVERRYEYEELSSCLLGKLDGHQFNRMDIDRILRLSAEKRGSWSSVHDPYWYRTLAHKFKDESSMKRRLKRIMRKAPGVKPLEQ